ncbi:11327_t:CDS:2, partial [Dentiscutata erythropus]
SSASDCSISYFAIAYLVLYNARGGAPLIFRKRLAEDEKKIMACWYMLSLFSPRNTPLPPLTALIPKLFWIYFPTLFIEEFMHFFLLRHFVHIRNSTCFTIRGCPAPEGTKDEDCCVCYGVGVGSSATSFYSEQDNDEIVDEDSLGILENYCKVPHHVAHRPCQNLNSRLTQIKLLRPMPTCPSCRGKLMVDILQKDLLEEEEVIGKRNNTNKWLVKLRSLTREWLNIMNWKCSLYNLYVKEKNNKMLRQQINGGFGIQQEVSQVPVVSTDLKFVCVPQNLSSSSENPVPQQLFSPAPSSPITSFDYLDSVTPDDIPEFKQYNKEKYESAKSGSRRRRKPTREECDTASSLDGYEEEDGNRQFLYPSVTHAEFRRQIHIQSEQRRRAEIKDGFEQLRRQLPFNTNGRKMSKATLLQK